MFSLATELSYRRNWMAEARTASLAVQWTGTPFDRSYLDGNHHIEYEKIKVQIQTGLSVE
jgi:hypothetical protein